MDINSLHASGGLEVGLEIVLKMSVGKEEKRKVGSILGWDNNKQIIVKIPDKTDFHYFIKTHHLSVGFINEGVVYGFYSKILFYVKMQDFNPIILKYPKSLETFPLRGEKRVRVHFPGTFSIVLDEKREEISSTFPCSILDISLEGCSITTEQKLDINKKILLSFLLPAQEYIVNIPGTIVNIRKRQTGDKHRFGIKYDEDEYTNEKIVHFISMAEQFGFR